MILVERGLAVDGIKMIIIALYAYLMIFPMFDSTDLILDGPEIEIEMETVYIDPFDLTPTAREPLENIIE